MVVKSLIATGLPLHISYVGEKEKLKLNAQTLKNSISIFNLAAVRIYPALIKPWVMKGQRLSAIL
jgi:hypothetical protein